MNWPHPSRRMKFRRVLGLSLDRRLSRSNWIIRLFAAKKLPAS